MDRYGCVAGYPNGTFKGGQAMTRYEAAALLNACLDRVTETTDELKRLMKEFQKELAVLRGRVDGLEARVGELEANQFSTTTKLSGQATFVVGANSFSGSAINTAANTVNRAPNEFTGRPRTPVPLPNATTFNHDPQLTFDTSFTGKDLLRTNLRAGNFGRSVFGGEPHSLALSTRILEQAAASGGRATVSASVPTTWPPMATAAIPVFRPRTVAAALATGTPARPAVFSSAISRSNGA